MDREQAIALVGYLVASTTGWNDDSVLVYTAELEKLSDYNAAEIAVQRIATTWSEARRPPISEVLDIYRRELARTQSLRRQVTARRATTFERGVEIARAAYESERNRLGKPVHLDKFDSWISRLRDER